MMNKITVTIYESVTNRSLISQDVVSMSFDKEWYTPYSSLNITFLSKTVLTDPNEVTVAMNSKIIHDGPIYTLESQKYSDGRFLITLYSRGYTAALGVNQPIPKINSNVDLNDVLTSNITLPKISCEANTKKVNYIYILDKDTLWDAVVTYTIKAYSSYPYIRNANTVMVTPPEAGYSTFTYTDDVLTTSYGTNLSNLISQINMKDYDDSYETYELKNTYATDRSVIRETKINTDMQWISDPQIALKKRIYYSNRAAKYRAAKVEGYNGEDLFDKFTVKLNNGIFLALKRIHRIHITANKNGIFTTLYTYFDSYSGDISLT